jgi:excisionase family DNA binding protein
MMREPGSDPGAPDSGAPRRDHEGFGSAEPGAGAPDHDGLSKARFLTVQEVADLLRVSSMTVYRLIKAGELSAVRVGRSFRVSEHDVDVYLAARYTQAG